MKHIKETEPAPVSGHQLYAVLYDGDTAMGTPDTWQIWDCIPDPTDVRVLECHPVINSAQFVQACNCHHELVKALQECITEDGAVAWKGAREAGQRLEAISNIARAALNKASR